MKEIPLTQGLFALVDDEDYDYLSQYNWCAEKKRVGYSAKRYVPPRGSAWIYMHRDIMKTPDYLVCDHKDGNPLNNQKYNLRNCTYSQNAQNQHRSGENYIGYKGASWDKHTSKWMSQIMKEGKNIYLGRHKTEEEAALAYNEAAIKYFGEFANLNQIRKEVNTEKQIA